MQTNVLVFSGAANANELASALSNLLGTAVSVHNADANAPAAPAAPVATGGGGIEPFGFGAGASDDDKRVWAVENLRVGNQAVRIAVSATDYRNGETVDIEEDRVFANLYREKDGYAKLGSARFDSTEDALDSVDTDSTNWLGVVELIEPRAISASDLGIRDSFGDTEPVAVAEGVFGFGVEAPNAAKMEWAVGKELSSGRGTYRIISTHDSLASAGRDARADGAYRYVNLYREENGYAKVGRDAFRTAAEAFAVARMDNTNYLGVALAERLR